MFCTVSLLVYSSVALDASVRVGSSYLCVVCMLILAVPLLVPPRPVSPSLRLFVPCCTCFGRVPFPPPAAGGPCPQRHLLVCIHPGAPRFPLHPCYASRLAPVVWVPFTGGGVPFLVASSFVLRVPVPSLLPAAEWLYPFSADVFKFPQPFIVRNAVYIVATSIECCT